MYSLCRRHPLEHFQLEKTESHPNYENPKAKDPDLLGPPEISHPICESLNDPERTHLSKTLVHNSKGGEFGIFSSLISHHSCLFLQYCAYLARNFVAHLVRCIVVMPNSDISFMPQQPLLKVEGKRQRKIPINPALIVALIIFFVTAVVAGGVYFYKLQVEKRVADLTKQLADTESTLNISDIEHYQRINLRINVAKVLLQTHSVFSVILNMLQESTAQNIGLTSLTYKEDKANSSIIIDGKADSYAAVYFQISTWRGMKPLVTGLKVTNLALAEESGVVSFTAIVTVDPEITKYSRLLQAQQRKQDTQSTDNSQTP